MSGSTDRSTFPGRMPRSFCPQSVSLKNLRSNVDIPYFSDYFSPSILNFLASESAEVPGVAGLRHIGTGGGLETTESLSFLCKLYDATKSDLRAILNQRSEDRAFVDQRTKACYEFNTSLDVNFSDPRYETIIGHEDAKGRVVVGPKNEFYCKSGYGDIVAPIPSYLQGPHVTLFGPPDSAKLSINAMNAYHRRLQEEPAIIEELLGAHCTIPKWGADDEDSKTPLRSDLIESGINLTRCFDGDLTFMDPNTQKVYQLCDTHRSIPIKRFPGLALPAYFLLFNGQPLPLHLYDFALHFFRHWNNPQALAFYIPKLESEEEARYVRKMLQIAEKMIQDIYPTYELGTIKLFIVLENPRAVFRVNEIMDELYPFFAGASLGWHDYLASTARLFKEDPNYRIPVKADPNIVIHHIAASHRLLADVVGSRGGLKIGGMYGVLPIGSDMKSASFQVSIKGFIKDVVAQLKRNLHGFWVAHPDFMRIGLAIVEAWELHKGGIIEPLECIVTSLLEDSYQAEVLDFIRKPDIKGLDVSDSIYSRSLLVADVKESAIIANNDPEEVRYNVFQSLQYLADWLAGNGCVALPAKIGDVAVRVMDDLATAERSRWEVWLEIYHKRFSVEDFLKIAFEEFHFIRFNKSTTSKIVQVKWDQRTEKWYPIAFRIMILLMTHSNPPEFATELLLPFTIVSVRAAADPWYFVKELDKEKFESNSYIERFCDYFSVCSSVIFAKGLANDFVLNISKARALFDSLTIDELKSVCELGNLTNFSVAQEISILWDLEISNFQCSRPEHLLDCHMSLIGSSDNTKNESARRIAVQMKKLNLLSSDHIEYAQVSDLIDKYVGGTSLKTLEILRRAKGGVLVIKNSEAMHPRHGSFGIEIMQVLAESVNAGEFKDNLVILLSFVSTEDRNELFDVNPGLYRIFGNKNIEFPERDISSLDSLWEIIERKLRLLHSNKLHEQIESSRRKHAVTGATITINKPGRLFENICFGDAIRDIARVEENSIFEVASLSKAVASCFAIEYFKKRGISLQTPVNSILSSTASYYRIPSGNSDHPEWGDQVTLGQLMNHSSLNMHYVNGIPLADEMPRAEDLLNGNEKYGYVPVCASKPPGSLFGYSGGGFIVLEHLLEALEQRSISELTEVFFDDLGMSHFSFDQKNRVGENYATGYTAAGEAVEGSRMMHPACAAGGLGTASDVAIFLTELTEAFQNVNCDGVISHDTAINMLYGVDLGSQSFIGAFMGYGIFIAEAGSNRIAIHQGANDGFRSLFMHCFHGPDVGKGFVMHCNAELNGILFISETAQAILREFKMEGVDLSKFKSNFLVSEIPKEQIVNIGYKELIFSSFVPDLPEKVPIPGPKDPLSAYNLAICGRVLSVTNQRFARAENLLSPFLPHFDPELFGRQGKIMDSWETVRHNQKPADVLIFELKVASNIRYVSLSTEYHLGNQPRAVSVDGRTDASEWICIVPMINLEGHSFIDILTEHQLDVSFSQIRVSIYPDGGLTRLGLYNESLPENLKYRFKTVAEAVFQRFDSALPRTLKPLAPPFHPTKGLIQSIKDSIPFGSEIDLASSALGGIIDSASNEHYGPAIHVISPFPPLSMFDGMESARSRIAGNAEFVCVCLANPSKIHRIEIDFTYFVNNNPYDICVEALIEGTESWKIIVPRHNVKAYAGNAIEYRISEINIFSHVKVITFPDGGFNRIRVYGYKT